MGKYTKPTTGAGRYRLFGMDYASPIPSIPDTTDGTYPITKQVREAGAYLAQQNDAMHNQAEPLLGKDSQTPTFARSAPFNWNKTAWELEGTKVYQARKR